VKLGLNQHTICCLNNGVGFFNVQHQIGGANVGHMRCSARVDGPILEQGVISLIGWLFVRLQHCVHRKIVGLLCRKVSGLMGCWIGSDVWCTVVITVVIGIAVS
jgi:hypothetical protein